VQRIRDHASQAVVLDAREVESLRALGIRDFDVVVLSLGGRVDSSALITLRLKELGVRNLVVKAASQDHARLLQLIGASEVIFPEREAAERLVRRLTTANLLDFIPLGESHSIRELAAAPELVGKTLAETRLRNRFGVQLVALRRAATGDLVVNPGPEARIQDSDELILLGANVDLDRLSRL
jgi:trk system potassium uptake protein TrkA